MRFNGFKLLIVLDFLKHYRKAKNKEINVNHGFSYNSAQKYAEVETRKGQK